MKNFTANIFQTAIITVRKFQFPYLMSGKKILNLPGGQKEKKKESSENLYGNFSTIKMIIAKYSLAMNQMK